MFLGLFKLKENALVVKIFSEAAHKLVAAVVLFVRTLVGIYCIHRVLRGTVFRQVVLFALQRLKTCSRFALKKVAPIILCQTRPVLPDAGLLILNFDVRGRF